MYLVKSLSRDKGSGRYTMYLPFSLTDSLGRKGQIHCVSARPLVPREGLYQIHGQSLNTHRGGHEACLEKVEQQRGGSPDRVARGLPTGGQGSRVYVLRAEPKEYKHFRPGTRPGGYRVPGREDRWPGWPRNCLCVKCLCAFSGPYSGGNPEGMTTFLALRIFSGKF